MDFFCFVSEIAKVRSSLFQVNGMKKEPLILPEAQGTTATLTEKVFVPVKEHPDVSTVDFITKFLNLSFYVHNIFHGTAANIIYPSCLTAKGQKLCLPHDSTQNH